VVVGSLPKIFLIVGSTASPVLSAHNSVPGRDLLSGWVAGKAQLLLNLKSAWYLVSKTTAVSHSEGGPGPYRPLAGQLAAGSCANAQCAAGWAP
jgi:hypothetical protein